MYTANYTTTQEMNHWNKGTFKATGKIGMTFTVPAPTEMPERLDITIWNKVDMWQRACDEASHYNGTTKIMTNSTNRKVLGNPEYIGAMNLANTYTNIFLGNSLNLNTPKWFFLEEIMYTRAEIVMEVFQHEKNDTVEYKDAMINCVKMSWVGQIFYAGFICGMGNNVLINCSYNYYYECNSGLLIYSDVSMLEYLQADSAVYQLHHITKTLDKITYEGQPAGEGSGNPIIDFFGNSMSEADMGYIYLTIGITAILGISLFAVWKIRRAGMRWRAQAIIKYEEELQHQKETPESEKINSDKTPKKEISVEKLDPDHRIKCPDCGSYLPLEFKGQIQKKIDVYCEKCGVLLTQEKIIQIFNNLPK
jgi:DNA-directed RNA polymerase subunit RPC12/RpoP